MRLTGFIKLRKHSMRRMLFGYMLALAFVLVAVVFAGSFLFGQYSTTEKKLSDTLSLQMEIFEREIVSHHENIAMRNIKLSEDASGVIGLYLYKEGISFDDLQNSQTHLKNIQDKFLDLLSEEILQTECSGAFILLDTTVNTSLADSENSKSGVYIHRSTADKTDDTLLLYRGNAQLGKSKGIMPHRKWKLEFNKTDFPDYDILTNVSADTPLYNAYFASDVVVLPGTSEKVMLLTVPVRGHNGKIYGICGFEISADTFQLYHSQPSTLDQLVCIFSKHNEDVINCDTSLASGITNGYNLAPEGSLKIRDIENGLYSFKGEGGSYIGMARAVKLACGENCSHMLSVMIPKYSYDKMSRENIIQIIVFILLLMFFAIICCGYLSKRYITPIVRRLEKLKQAEKDEREYEKSYSEIDDLFAFLEEKEKELSSAQSRVDKLSYSRKTEIDPDDYEYFKDGIKMLTKTERFVFDLYMQGKTAKEIMEIAEMKERALKFHNSNIYSKLGVTGKKELLRFATLYEKENGGKI